MPVADTNLIILDTAGSGSFRLGSRHVWRLDPAVNGRVSILARLIGNAGRLGFIALTPGLSGTITGSEDVDRSDGATRKIRNKNGEETPR